MEANKVINYHGWKVYQDYDSGYAPYFLNTIMQRIHKKKACNVVVTGEAGEGKSYMACDICRVVMGKDRFSLDQVVFSYKQFMDLVLRLPANYPIVFDEPSYSMGKREWYKQLNRALVQTIESFRYKRHPLFVAIINKSLLDKTIRDHLIQFQVLVRDRGRASVYRIHSSQFTEKVYHKWVCDLEYGLFDYDKCDRDSCLDCSKLMQKSSDTFVCNIFRARYERKKNSIQTARYSQAKELSERVEAKQWSMEQIERLSLTLKEMFVKDGKINVQNLRMALSDGWGIRLSNVKAYELRAMLLKHHPEILDI